MPPDNNGKAVPEAPRTSAPDAAPAVGSVPAATAAPAAAAQAPEGMTLAELNEHLGKTFPTKESALKALKDTFSYVGKKKEDIAAEVRAEFAQDKRFDELAKGLEIERNDRFYDKNPQFAPYRKTIEALGKNPVEVVQSESFKALFDKAVEYDKTAKQKNVLDSNPRLAQSRSSLQEAAQMSEKTGGEVTPAIEEKVAEGMRKVMGL